jgi:hypothetical protein
MVNARNKGARGERYFATRLRPIFPSIRRNAGVQAQSGGVDLEETDPFNIECKVGKAYNIKKVTQMLRQVRQEGKKANWGVVCVKPDREPAYVLMYFEDFYELIENMKANGIF